MTACAPFFGPDKYATHHNGTYKGAYCVDFMATGKEGSYLNKWFSSSGKLDEMYKQYMFFTEDKFTRANDFNSSSLLLKGTLEKVLF